MPSAVTTGEPLGLAVESEIDVAQAELAHEALLTADAAHGAGVHAQRDGAVDTTMNTVGDEAGRLERHDLV